jgi:DnaJ-class molecular chaperone
MSVRAGNNPFDATSGAAKRAADTVSDKAKSFWNDEVLGAKKAMERDASKNPGEDVRATVDVTLEQSVLGAEVPLTYSRRRVCPGCGGAGRLPQTFIDCDTCEGNRGTVSEDVSVTVSVPGGVSSGATLRLRDQGDEGSPPGQLYVTVRAAAMSDGAAIVRDGNDLISRDIVARFPKKGAPTSVRVRTVEGEWGTLSVPADAKVGQALRIRGRGAPAKPGGDERGDHLFVIGKIVVEEPRGGDEEDASEE